MFTAKPMPGKFEGNRSQLLAETVYKATMEGNLDWEAGDLTETDAWFGMILGKRHDFLIEEDHNGFVTVTVLDKKDTEALTDTIEADFAGTY